MTKRKSQLTGDARDELEWSKDPEGPERGEVHRALAVVAGRHYVGQESGIQSEALSFKQM